MKHAFEEAGLDVSRSRLAVIAFELLKQADRNPAVAVEPFVDAVTAGGGLLMELLGVTRAEIRKRAMIYLQDRRRDLEGRAGQRSRESQGTIDRPAAEDAASHEEDESQESTDRGTATRTEPTDGSLHQTESHGPGDPIGRPVKVREHKRGKPAGSKIAKSAALAVATSRSVFAMKIGYGEHTLGTMTKFDFRQLERRGIAVSHVAKRFLTEVTWPDEQDTKLQDLATEEMAKEIVESGYRVLDAMQLTGGLN